MKSVDIDVTKKPSETQRKMLREAAKRPITFDEDCPELTEEQLKKLKE